MSTPALSLLDLLPLAGKSELTMPDLAQLHGQLLSDGSRLHLPKVAPDTWATLPPGTTIAFRLTDSAAVLTGQIVENRLGQRLLPTLLVSNPRSAEPLRVRRKQLREVRRVEQVPPLTD